MEDDERHTPKPLGYSPVTLTGIEALSVVPLPRSPLYGPPGDPTVPVERRAATCDPALEIAVTPLNPVTATGTKDLVVVPFPSSPKGLPPQHFTVFVVSSAQVSKTPVTTPHPTQPLDRNRKRRSGCGPVPKLAGAIVSLALGRPRCKTRQQAMSVPADIAVSPPRPLTTTGAEELTVVPFPSWPYWVTLSPQHFATPVLTRAQAD